MPRIQRLTVPGVALHVVQRGNNRQAVFFHESDYVAYLDLLFESSDRYEVSVHAYVCMTNHVHILVTPWDERSVSRLMQRLGALYTSGINSVYHHAESLGDYPIRPHPEWLALGSDAGERRQRYSELVA
jgi:putative transposase